MPRDPLVIVAVLLVVALLLVVATTVPWAQAEEASDGGSPVSVTSVTPTESQAPDATAPPNLPTTASRR